MKSYYIASPLFTPDQLSLIEKYEEFFKSTNQPFFSPRNSESSKSYDPKCTDIGKKKLMIMNIFEDNIEEIDATDNMLAVTKFFDIGTLFEIGYKISSRVGKLIFTDDNIGIYELIKCLPDYFITIQSPKVFTPEDVKGSKIKEVSEKLNIICIDDRPAESFLLMGALYQHEFPFVTYSEKGYGSNIMLSAPSLGHLQVEPNLSVGALISKATEFLTPSNHYRIHEAEDLNRIID